MRIDPLPRIRYVEAMPVEHEGRRMYLLRDPTGYANAGLTVSPDLLFLLQFFDGSTPFSAAAKEFQSHFGRSPDQTEIEQIARMMDEHHFLDTEDFAFFKAQIDQEFLDGATHPSICFDQGATAEDIRELLDDAFKDAGFAPGPQIPKKPGSILGIVAPHIDYQRGAGIYPKAYAPLFERFEGDTVVILGTNHQPSDSKVVLTDKDFETPFGIVQTNKTVMAALAESIDPDPFQDQICHRNEHSIELAATMLAYVGLHKSVRIVPILLSGLAVGSLTGERPGDDPQVASAIGALAALLREKKEKAVVIASADLAHVGLQFGDEAQLEDYHLKDVEVRDWESLDAVCRGSADEFFNYIAKEGDRRRICGLSPIFVALSALSPKKGTLAGYEQWVDPNRNGAVSFAAVIWEK